METKPLLSILICTVPERRAQLETLLRHLRAQIDAQVDKALVEILFNADPRALVGVKRNALMDQAVGKYVVFVDDDDAVLMDYVSLILQAISTGPDVVGICGVVMFDRRRAMVFRHATEYRVDFNKPDLHERMPNHLCPTRTALARQFPFPALNCCEDSMRAKNMVGAFKSSAMIERPIYLYDYRPSQSLTQGPNAKRRGNL